MNFTIISFSLILLAIYVIFLFTKTWLKGKECSPNNKKKEELIKLHSKLAHKSLLFLSILIIFLEISIRTGLLYIPSENFISIWGIQTNIQYMYLRWIHFFFDFLFVGLLYLIIKVYNGKKNPILHKKFVYYFPWLGIGVTITGLLLITQGSY